VFVYDRAGLGRSDPAPRPRSAQDIVNDLRAALAGADVLPPYVLVGHSFGGLTVRLYASQHPTDVAGIVMVDGTNELQYARYLALVPAEERDDWRRRYEGENAEGVKLEESAAQVRAAAPLPLVPLVVVTAGRPPGPMPDSSVDVLRLQRVRSELQEELATRVPSGRQVIAERSGHFVQQDQPDLVVEVVLSVVEQTRRSWRRDRGGDGAASASDELPSKHQ
jgi:pimeloyl-ACP methyl ester carboxylesterase